MLRRLASIALIGCCLASSANAQEAVGEPPAGQAAVGEPPAGQAAVGEPPAGQAPPKLPSVEDICRTIETAAAENDLPVDFFTRLIWQESRFNTRAVSRAGARGIAQFMPRTAIWRGLVDPFDAVEALRESADYLRELRKQFGNLGLAAAAYNGGSGRVQNWLDGRGGLPSETRAYVRIITGHSADDWRSPEPPDEQSGSPKGIPCPQIANLVRSSPERSRRERPQTVTAPWGVQVAGNWSEGRALAEYSRLQARYAAILGDRAPVIIRSRMAGRGSAAWSRVRVGAQSREEAEKLCARLKQAGGSCIVLRNSGKLASG
jgi:Transglycosylase SLT domain/SPOR domain